MRLTAFQLGAMISDLVTASFHHWGIGCQISLC
uniref:Uncharacterized protein n=1 Tax=Arundo donax TaxID=35708 RepID=A0A0A9FRX3_ARUDO